MRINTMLVRALGCGVAMVALSTHAQALEANAFVERFEAVYAEAGYGFDLGEATLDGDTIVVNGGSVTIPELGGETASFDTEITFSGVVEGEDGSYRAASVTIPDIEVDFHAEPAGSFSLRDVRVDGLYLPPGEPPTTIGMLQLFESFTTGPLSVSKDGVEVLAFSSSELSGTYEPAFGSEDLTSSDALFSIEGIVVDVAEISKDDAEALAVIEGLGIGLLTGSLQQTVSWDLEDGRMVMDRFLIDFDGQGALDITMDIAGITPEVFERLTEMQAEVMATGAEADEAALAKQQADSVELLQEIVLNSFSVRYDDDSFAGRALDFFAADAGVERASFAAGIGAIAKAMIAGSGVTGLEAVAGDALDAFLADPKSIEIRLEPSEAGSVLDLVTGVAQGGDVGDAGLTVEANVAD